MEGLARGALTWAVGPGLALLITFSDLPLYAVHAPSAAAFRHRWSHWGELTRSDKDGKEAKSAFCSRLFPSQWRGCSAPREQAG